MLKSDSAFVAFHVRTAPHPTWLCSTFLLRILAWSRLATVGPSGRKMRSSASLPSLPTDPNAPSTPSASTMAEDSTAQLATSQCVSQVFMLLENTLFVLSQAQICRFEPLTPKSRPKSSPKLGGRQIEDTDVVSIGYRKSYGGFCTFVLTNPLMVRLFA